MQNDDSSKNLENSNYNDVFRYRLEITGSETTSYFLDDIFTALSQVVVKCDHLKRKPEQNDANFFPISNSDANTCNYCLTRQKQHFNYLIDRFCRYIDESKIDIWDWKGEKSRSTLQINEADKFRENRLRLLAATIQGKDLIEFLKKERCQLIFLNSQTSQNSKSPVKQKDVSVNLQHAKSPNLLNLEFVNDCTFHQPPAAHPGSEIRKRARKDGLSCIIDDILKANPYMTATQVMTELVKQAGTGECIVAAVSEGVKWEPFNGEEKILTVKQLTDRIARWRKANIIDR